MNYLNTRPLLYGIERSSFLSEMELVGDYPANVAKALLENKIDIGLVPVAIIPQLSEYHLYTDYGIGCNGNVATVCIFSDVPISEVESVILDYQSRTSVQLAQVLLKEFYKVSPRIVAATDNFQENIKGTTAAVLIGDRCFEQAKLSKYTYDLGEAWKIHTGLPFLFAAWIANKPIPEDFIARFNEANKMGLNHIEEIVSDLKYEGYDLLEYYTNNIDYRVDEFKLQALNLFLSKMKQL